ncbi:MAG TPA: DUF554 domain-containing protein [Desulfovibrio sp.]|jgi:uncharacterized membrane protein YqgA involved in biofilm formation|uniref:DUF554 domain-containing protein n=1 Tax=Desulfovibrio TaxID=872 RepID=UPI00041634A7|nr:MULTISPECIES: DUF554 domain-containing protein [Desulfovibrio]MDY0305929.1 DUF554 domain-containing protein [Desulfovibrionaceae bacterium]HMM38363.1 DUF554 domain-containing protein [Desulfovibrio sp.]
MLPLGSLVNALAIILGSVIGMLLHNRFPERVRAIVFQGLGLCVLLIGIQMALKVENILILIFSVLLGGILGELLNLEGLFEILAGKLKAVVRSKNAAFTDGLITSSLIFCIGAMAIIGSFDEGIRGDATVLYTKSILDGFASVALASTYGAGVLFSFLPVLLYQGGLTLFAGVFQQYFSPLLIAQLTATGGVLILGIGFTLLDIKRVKLSNLLPALPVVVVLTLIFG